MNEQELNLSFIRWEITQDAMYLELERLKKESTECNDRIVERRNNEGIDIRVHNILTKR